MKMRMPSFPLIAVDPYFSVWTHDEINSKFPYHWTGSRNAMLGIVWLDGKPYRFLGASEHEAIKQVSIDINAMATTAVFENEGIRLKAEFLSPMLVTDLYYSSRPVSYLKLSYESLDGTEHEVKAELLVSEELVLNKAGEGRALAEEVNIEGGRGIRMGNGEQKPLNKSGDDVRIDWGYFYLAAKGEAEMKAKVFNSLYAVSAEITLSPDALFAFAYDDIDSLIYFGKPVKAYWKKGGKDITEAISEALSEYDTLLGCCNEFSADLIKNAAEKGGEKYAELLSLAYRQIMAGHKLVVDQNGNNIYVSKECFSNGCAATVDVTYPSAPMYLYYNPELLKGMLRPIFAYARSENWKFDFAPHDVGQYPILNGQVYEGNAIEYQMPVEECGNMLILAAAICQAEGKADFACENLDIIDLWSKYLVKYGRDPENQLCTDDFAGHLAHNVNLSIKAIMGMAGYSKILGMLGREAEAKEYFERAKEYADSLCERAKNSDGSYRLAFDRPDTFSLKYNSVWDKLWKTELFADEFYKEEIKRYKSEALAYGVPLDSREKYTKSDWLHWVSCLTDNKADFEYFTALLWDNYNNTHNRVPLTDWYYANTSEMVGFRHRTVQGGLFLRLMLT